MIPTYNQKKYVGCAIESALAQTYSNIEIVVSDDASSDSRMSEVLDKYEGHSKVKIHRNQSNIGRVANYRKTLYERVRGDWVVNLDGDDFFLDSKFIEDAVRFVEAHREAVAVVGGCSILEQSGMLKVMSANMRSSYLLDPVSAYEAVLSGAVFPFHSSTMYSRNIAISIGFYEQEIISSDLESFLRLFAHGPIGIVPRQVSVWREHEKNTSGTMSFNDYVDNIAVFASVKKMEGSDGLAVSGHFLGRWAKQYAYKKGKDYAYRLLKETHNPRLCLEYIAKLASISPLVSVAVFVEPKILFNVLWAFFRKH